MFYNFFLRVFRVLCGLDLVEKKTTRGHEGYEEKEKVRLGV